VFNLSGSEIVVILILALVVLGPEKLPEAMRKAGRAWAELRKVSSSFQEEVRKGFEEPVNEVKKTASTVRSAATLNPAKPRYNPAKDPPPALADGESVADPDPAEVAASTPGPDARSESPAAAEPPAEPEAETATKPENP
jgi:sec-independent protein translocase protein TatB